MPVRVLISSEGERIQISQQFFESSAALTNADFYAHATGANYQANGAEEEPVEFPVPFTAPELRRSSWIFNGNYEVTENLAKPLLRLADFLACPIHAMLAIRAIESQWAGLFRGGYENADEIMEWLDMGAFLPLPYELADGKCFRLSDWTIKSLSRVLPAVRRAPVLPHRATNIYALSKPDQDLFGPTWTLGNRQMDGRISLEQVKGAL